MTTISLTNDTKLTYEYGDTFDLNNDLIISNDQSLESLNPTITLFVNSKLPINEEELEYYSVAQYDINSTVISYNIHILDISILLFKNIGEYMLQISYDSGNFFQSLTVKKKVLDIKFCTSFLNCDNDYEILFGQDLPIYITSHFDNIFTSELNELNKQVNYISLVLTHNNNVLEKGTINNTLYEINEVTGNINIDIYDYESDYLDLRYNVNHKIIVFMRNQIKIMFKKPLFIQHGTPLPDFIDDDVEIINNNKNININNLTYVANETLDSLMTNNNYKLMVSNNTIQMSVGIVQSLLPNVYQLKLQVGSDPLNTGICNLVIIKRKNKIINSLESFYHNDPTTHIDVSNYLKMEDPSEGSITYDIKYNNEIILNNIINFNDGGVVNITAIYTGSMIYHPEEIKITLLVKPEDILFEFKENNYVMRIDDTFNTFIYNLDNIELGLMTKEKFTETFKYEITYTKINQQITNKPVVILNDVVNNVEIINNTIGYIKHDMYGINLESITIPRGMQLLIMYENDTEINQLIVYHGTYLVVNNNINFNGQNIILPKIKSIKIEEVVSDMNLSNFNYGVYDINLNVLEHNPKRYDIKTKKSTLTILPKDITFELKEGINRIISYKNKINLTQNDVNILSNDEESHKLITLELELFNVETLTDTSNLNIGDHEITVRVYRDDIDINMTKTYTFTIIRKKIIVDFWQWWNKIKGNYHEVGAEFIANFGTKSEIINEIQKYNPTSFNIQDNFKLIPNVNLQDYCRSDIYYDISYRLSVLSDNNYVESDNYELVFMTNNNIFYPKVYIKPFIEKITEDPRCYGFMVKKVDNNFTFNIHKPARNNMIEFNLTNVLKKLPYKSSCSIEFDFTVIKNLPSDHISISLDKVNKQVYNLQNIIVYKKGENKNMKRISCESDFNTSPLFRISITGHNRTDVFKISNFRLVQRFNDNTPNKYNYIELSRNYIFNEINKLTNSNIEIII